MTDYTWDGFRRISQIDHTLAGGGSLHKFDYLYDKVHNRRMEKNSCDATWMATLPAAVQSFLGGRNGKGDVYAYDMAYRLVDARYDVTNPLTEVASPGTQPFGKRVQYTMDGLGNRSQTLCWPPTPPTTVTYSTDVVNQYTSVGGTSRTHDSNGNLTDDGTYLFAYDFQNRLVELKNKATQTVIATYRYDALGRRVEKAVVGGATTRYILDGVQVVEEYDGSASWQARYVYEDGIDQPRCMDRADIADVNGNSNTAEVLRFHYHQQALGSVTEMTQPTGAVVEWVVYDVYGQPTIRDMNGAVISQSAVGNPYLYTGREFDPESGLFFYRARTYDPGAGRFLQRDPLGSKGGLNYYRYVTDSPATRVDPLGLLDTTPPDLQIRSPAGHAPTAPPSSRLPLVLVVVGYVEQWLDDGWVQGSDAPTWFLRLSPTATIESTDTDAWGPWWLYKMEVVGLRVYRVLRRYREHRWTSRTWQRHALRARQLWLYGEFMRGGEGGRDYGARREYQEKRVFVGYLPWGAHPEDTGWCPYWGAKGSDLKPGDPGTYPPPGKAAPWPDFSDPFGDPPHDPTKPPPRKNPITGP